MPKTHSDNGPSSLRRRELCPGSYRLEKDLPEESSEAADAGTKLHRCVELMLLARDDTPIPEVVGLEPEQLEMVEWCVERAKALLWAGARIVSEKYIDLRWFHPSIEGGTPDLVIVEDFVQAIVIDFKFGFKRVPPAAENLQLACYAEGVRNEFDVSEVQVCILQPALNVCDISSPLVGTIERARAAASAALNPEGAFNPSLEACQYCKARGKCPAQLALAKASETLPAVTVEAVALLPMNTISEFLALWEERGIDGIVGAMQQRLLEACLTGYEDKNWKLGRGLSRRKFTDEAEATLRALCEARGKPVSDLYTQPELLSVAQVEKVLGKSKSVVAAFEPLTWKTEGKPKLERVKNAAN